jgi:hypothetical protein
VTPHFDNGASKARSAYLLDGRWPTAEAEQIFAPRSRRLDPVVALARAKATILFLIAAFGMSSGASALDGAFATLPSRDI